MSLGIECLVTDDEGRAWAIAQQLNDINLKRREIEAEMQDTALLHLDDFQPGRQPAPSPCSTTAGTRA